MTKDQLKKFIVELGEENRRLSEKNKIYSNALVQEKEKNRKLSEGKIIYASEKEQRHYVDILEENKKLKDIIKNIVYLYKEEPTELGEYVKSGFKGGMSN